MTEPQLDLFGGATPAHAIEWPRALQELARRELADGRHLDADEAGAIVHALEGLHDAGLRCPYDATVGREALRRLRRREGRAEGQTRSPRLADTPTAGPRARVADPETSHEAAATIAPAALRKSQEALLRVYRDLGGMSDDRLVDVYAERADDGDVPRQSPSGIRTRRNELVGLGLVHDSGRKTILEGSGRRAIVWDLTPAGATGWRPGRVAGTIEAGGTDVRPQVCQDDPEPDL